MITVPAIVRRALAAWEAHQRRKRFARLLTINPELRAAHEARCRHRINHQPSLNDLKAMHAAMTAELRREVRHG